jgi:O-antigen/teichoic acid export membrane protein
VTRISHIRASVRPACRPVAELSGNGADWRSRERYRRVALTAITAAFGRGANLITMLISVPLALRYLGNEQFGVFATLVAVTAMVGFADLGLGNGLVNAVADANGRDDVTEVRRAISTAFLLLSALAVALATAFAVTFKYVDWAALLNVSGPGVAREVGPAVAAVVGCMLLNLPFGLVQRVQIGLQEGFRANAWNALGAPLGLGLMAVAIAFHLGLAWIIAAVTAGFVLASATNAAVFFLRQRPDLRPVVRQFNLDVSRRLLGAGIAFFVLQIGVVVTFQTDAIVLTRILGPTAVTAYSVPLRLFLFVPFALSVVLAPLWPAYGEALTRGDVKWVRETVVRSVRLTVLVSVTASVVLAFIASPLVHLWVGGLVTPSRSLLVALALFAIVISVSNAVSMFLNGTRVISIQAVLTSVMIGINLGLSIVLTQRVGISGVVWGTVIAQTTCFLIPALVVAHRALRRTSAVAAIEFEKTSPLVSRGANSTPSFEAAAGPVQEAAR